MMHTSNARVSGASLVDPMLKQGARTLLVSVKSIHSACDSVNVITLVGHDGTQLLPAFSAGAHVDVHLPIGLSRSYSLCNAPGETDRYVIAVLRDPASRGGSVWLHDALKQGDLLTISYPRNNFPLDEEPEHLFMISGGIGITPILSMIHQLRKKGKSATLLYCARSRRTAPFLVELSRLCGDRISVIWHFDDEAGGPPDLSRFIAQVPDDGHIYCCGPSAMLKSFDVLCEDRPSSNVHTERFKVDAPSEPASTASGLCQVTLARTGVTFSMQKGVPVLQGIQSTGIEPDWSCGEGVCGACETKVVSGEVDHRDGILSAAQRSSNEVMMICVSCCRSDELVLDL